MLSRADVDFGSNQPLVRLIGKAQAEVHAYFRDLGPDYDDQVSRCYAARV
jgi:hypothetical protein